MVGKTKDFDLIDVGTIVGWWMVGWLDSESIKLKVDFDGGRVVG